METGRRARRRGEGLSRSRGSRVSELEWSAPERTAKRPGSPGVGNPGTTEVARRGRARASRAGRARPARRALACRDDGRPLGTRPPRRPVRRGSGALRDLRARLDAQPDRLFLPAGSPAEPRRGPDAGDVPQAVPRRRPLPAARALHRLLLPHGAQRMDRRVPPRGRAHRGRAARDAASGRGRRRARRSGRRAPLRGGGARSPRAPRRAPAGPAQGARAGVARGAQLRRDRGPARDPGRHREIAHVPRPATPARRLGGAAPARGSGLMAGDDQRPEHEASMRALLAATRRELRALPGSGPERERELVEHILAATTRSRVPAARRRVLRISLAAAAAALVAWSYLALRTSVSVHPAAEEALALARAVPASAPAPAVRPAAVADVLAVARAELAAAASGAPRTRTATVSADAPLELRLLEARARGLRERRWDPWLREVPLTDAGTLSLALWCEVQLDRYVLSGARPPAWKTAMRILEQGLAAPADGRVQPESARLLARALARAREYGWTESRGAQRPPADARLWTREWFDDLEAAGREAGLADSRAWRAWIDWRGL